MTEEQIAELEQRERWAQPYEIEVAPEMDYEYGGVYLKVRCERRDGDYPVVGLIVAMRRALPRLLEERKRLLAGMRDAKAALRFAHGQYTCAEGAADDAIEYAEEAAP